ncbi:MAG: sulfite exporter TauE/SafE family protein [Devosiaceae bacterium]|nr:sulfite exporter TauE/SafE family protein [Devosiaceae bacterium]
MPDFISIFIAPGLDAYSTILLIVLSAFTSAITASFGLGGGSLLIAVMSLLLPAIIVVPVHGAVQLGSNGGRAILRRSYIQWQFVGWFVLGSALGALLGVRVATIIPDNWFKGAIALFLLYSVWAPKPKISDRGAISTTIAGIFTSAVGMIVGISGPLVMTFLRHLSDRRQIVGTHAFLMTSQNLFKFFAFALFGFAFWNYLPLILAMVASGFLGTYAGGLFLDKIPETLFRLGFRVLLTIIAIDLFRRAVFGA